MPIEEGMSVRQGQTLFYLPDLNEMEVAVALNESIVDRNAGQRTQIRFEALPRLVLSGRCRLHEPDPGSTDGQG